MCIIFHFATGQNSEPARHGADRRSFIYTGCCTQIRHKKEINKIFNMSSARAGRDGEV